MEVTNWLACAGDVVERTGLRLPWRALHIRCCPDESKSSAELPGPALAYGFCFLQVTERGRGLDGEARRVGDIRAQFQSLSAGASTLFEGHSISRWSG